MWRKDGKSSVNTAAVIPVLSWREPLVWSLNADLYSVYCLVYNKSIALFIDKEQRFVDCPYVRMEL